MDLKSLFDDANTPRSASIWRDFLASQSRLSDDPNVLLGGFAHFLITDAKYCGISTEGLGATLMITAQRMLDR